MYFPRENRPKMCPILTVLPVFCCCCCCCFFRFGFGFFFCSCFVFFCFVLFLFLFCFFLLLNDSPFRGEIFHRMTPRFKFLSKHSANSKDECRPRETIWSSVGATESPSHELYPVAIFDAGGGQDITYQKPVSKVSIRYSAVARVKISHTKTSGKIHIQ